MSHREQLYQWNHIIARHLPTLSKTQVYCLALWTFGMVLARSCALTAVVATIAALWEQKPDNLRQQLREFYKEAKAKAGDKRQEIHVETCFCGLLAWVLSWWKANQIALAVDASPLADRFVVLAVSVLYRGCAIPVAWSILPANTKGTWRKEWLRMLRKLAPAVPKSVSVLVLADRGLYARWLFRRIVRLGWHPLLRVNSRCYFRAAGSCAFLRMGSYVRVEGSSWSGRGSAFASVKARLDCTLLAFYGKGHQEPWLMLTDLAPESGEACWYGLRTWIEQGFKFLKRAGWQWNHTRMTDPARVQRFWLILSVATLWLLSEGDSAPSDIPEGTFPPILLVKSSVVSRTHWDHVGIFHAGWLCILVHFLRQEPLPEPQFVPEPWPRTAPIPRLNLVNKVNKCEQKVAA